MTANLPLLGMAALLALSHGACIESVRSAATDSSSDTAPADTAGDGDTSPPDDTTIPDTTGDTGPVDTRIVDTAGDTRIVDTAGDTTARDTIEVDTTARDTTEVDTTARDTTEVDTTARDTIEFDTIDPTDGDVVACTRDWDCESLQGPCERAFCDGGTCTAEPFDRAIDLAGKWHFVSLRNNATGPSTTTRMFSVVSSNGTVTSSAQALLLGASDGVAQRINGTWCSHDSGRVGIVDDVDAAQGGYVGHLAASGDFVALTHTVRDELLVGGKVLGVDESAVLNEARFRMVGLLADDAEMVSMTGWLTVENKGCSGSAKTSDGRTLKFSRQNGQCDASNYSGEARLDVDVSVDGGAAVPTVWQGQGGAAGDIYLMTRNSTPDPFKPPVNGLVFLVREGAAQPVARDQYALSRFNAGAGVPIVHGGYGHDTRTYAIEVYQTVDNAGETVDHDLSGCAVAMTQCVGSCISTIASSGHSGVGIYREDINFGLTAFTRVGAAVQNVTPAMNQSPIIVTVQSEVGTGPGDSDPALLGASLDVRIRRLDQ